MTWRLADAAERQRVLLMVSKFAHCLNDLLFRTCDRRAQPGDRRGRVQPPGPRPARRHATACPFHHIPVTTETKPEAEAALLDLVRDASRSTWWCWPATCRSSPTTCAGSSTGRAINIHHSFLPSFKGAKPYHQAHARGVKLIGATAHYVTADLDEGPIIEQEVDAGRPRARAPTSSPPSAGSRRAGRWPARCGGTPRTGSCSTATGPSSSVSRAGAGTRRRCVAPAATGR